MAGLIRLWGREPAGRRYPACCPQAFKYIIVDLAPSPPPHSSSPSPASTFTQAFSLNHASPHCIPSSDHTPCGPSSCIPPTSQQQQQAQSYGPFGSSQQAQCAALMAAGAFTSTTSLSGQHVASGSRPPAPLASAGSGLDSEGACGSLPGHGNLPRAAAYTRTHAAFDTSAMAQPPPVEGGPGALGPARGSSFSSTSSAPLLLDLRAASECGYWCGWRALRTPRRQWHAYVACLSRGPVWMEPVHMGPSPTHRGALHAVL